MTPTPPVVVGLVRALVLAALASAVAGITAVIAWLTSADLGDFAWLIPVGIPGLRVLEAWLLDQQRGQADQAGPLGGAPADPTAYVTTPPAARPSLDLDPEMLAKVQEAIEPLADRLSQRKLEEVAARAALTVVAELRRRRDESGHAGFSVLAFVLVGLVALLITGSLGWALLAGLVPGAAAAPW